MRRASTQVVEALKKIQVAAPGTTVSAITPKQVAEAVKGVNVNTDQFARLVEQHKLRRFMQSEPPLADVLERLVHYGTPTAEPLAQEAPPPPQ